MILFGSVFGGENVITFKMAIVKSSNDNMTQSFISIFEEYEGIDAEVKEKRNESIEEMAKKLIEDDEYIVVIFLPENFSQVIFTQTKLIIFYDESADINIQNIALGTVSGIIDAFSQEISKRKIEFAKKYGNISDEEATYIEGIAQPINVSINGYSSVKKELKYIDFLVPGLISMTIMWTGVSGVASSLVEDRVKGIRQRILATPISRFSIVAGETMGNIMLIGLQIIILLIVAVYLFNITISGKLWLFSIIIIIGMISMIGIGLVISSLSKTAEEASQLGMLINFPMMFLSGIFFPITKGWMYYVSRIFPLTYINEAMREVIIKGAVLQDIFVPFIISLIFSISIFIIGTILLMRREEE